MYAGLVLCVYGMSMISVCMYVVCMLCVCVVCVCGLIPCVCIRVYVRVYVRSKEQMCIVYIYFAGALYSMRMRLYAYHAHPLP